MSMEIPVELIKKFKQGALLEPPDDAKVRTNKWGNQEHIWRETFQIRSINIGQKDGLGYVSFKLIIPGDVYSQKNQGRISDLFMGFPDDVTSKQFEMSTQNLWDLFNAVGYKPILNGQNFNLETIDKDALVNMRVNAQCVLGAGESGIERLNIKFFRAPK